MPRTAGVKNRNYPSLPLVNAILVAREIDDKASGMQVSRLTLAGILGSTPGSSAFKELLLASRAYGLTNGGVNALEFSLTDLGVSACSADEGERLTAMRNAVLGVTPYQEFLKQFNGRKIPTTPAFKEFLEKNASVPEGWAIECIERILADARLVGFTSEIKGSEYIDLSGATAVDDHGEIKITSDEAPLPTDESLELSQGESRQQQLSGHSRSPETHVAKKLFIAHGKNRKPLEQLKAILDKFSVKYAVAIDEPHAGRPISAKVASLMREDCSSAIFIFTRDEKFFKENEKGDQEEVWRPSENVVYELGAAAILYDRRIVIFKEKGVSFPSDFSDLGYITFEADSLSMQTADLFSELVALDIIEVRAKG